MRQTLVIARLTVREAARRKLLAVFFAITVALVSLSAWGFYRLSHTRSITSGEVQIAIPQALILFMFMFSFVVALSASAIASPAVYSEVESGVLQTVVTRTDPTQRGDDRQMARSGIPGRGLLVRSGRNGDGSRRLGERLPAAKPGGRGSLSCLPRAPCC